MPATIDDVTNSWMTDVLRASGAIGAEHSVALMSIEPFAEGLGFLSVLFRATLSYDGDPPDAPKTVIIKLITDLEVQRGIAETLQFYPREIRFYSEVAESAGIRSPVAYAAMMADDSSEFVLVLQDVSNLRALDQAAGVERADVLLAADTMAKMHGTFFDTDLSRLADTFLPMDNPIYRAALPQVFASGWPTAKSVAADLLSPDIVAFGDRYADLVPWFCERFSEADTTLVHADWRADNLLVDDDTGEMVVIDFQLVGIGTPTYDLGYFLSQSVEPDVRADVGEAAIDRYFESLAETGADFDRNELHDGLRLAVAWCLIYPVAQFAAWSDLPEVYQKTALRMLRRSVSAIAEFDALALVQ